MRNKYTNQFENDMITLAPFHTLDELLEFAKKQYKTITKKQLTLYLSRKKIRYKDFDYDRSKRTRNLGDNVPIGTERIKPDGMVQVKIAKDKWEYKQRLIYSKHYNIELTSDDYIIFLDQDRTNFDINNLVRITRRESSILSNQRMFSKDAEVTRTGILTAKLMIKLKEVE